MCNFFRCFSLPCSDLFSCTIANLHPTLLEEYPPSQHKHLFSLPQFNPTTAPIQFFCDHWFPLCIHARVISCFLLLIVVICLPHCHLASRKDVFITLLAYSFAALAYHQILMHGMCIF
ncbi:hypothetical protein B0H34DRAFT_135583 [Crassisporium funariophilum]|nr:hypothetical protein B0H34DRAFT_135583 [Crassisporium funariophilum]